MPDSPRPAVATRTPARAATRVSSACLPCRERHIRCGAEKPRCKRCAASDRPCHYTKSRRGGLDRAALAAFRSRQLAEPRSSPRLAQQHLTPPSLDASFTSAFDEPDPLLPASPIPYGGGVFGSHVPSELPTFQSPIAETPDLLASPPSLWGADGAFLDLYYLRFHRHHPLCLPKAHFTRLLGDSAHAGPLWPLFLAMTYIGALYARSAQARERQEAVRQAIADAGRPDAPDSPFLVQGRLLFAIALYWGGVDDKARARAELDAAAALARRLGMFRREFAARHGRGDAVREESWRRTWWQIVVVDASIAATERRFSVPTCSGVVATVDLPCEEHEYESGVIPRPRTLDEFNSRELDPEDHVYSSFAYLVGATHAIALVLTTVPSYLHLDGSSSVVQDIDAIVDGWAMLLPDTKKNMLARDGEMDVLIFQAHMIIHAVTVLVHRPFSDLAVHPAEFLATCTPRPTEHFGGPVLVAVHTARCVRAVEAQVRLLALPWRHNNNNNDNHPAHHPAGDGDAAGGDGGHLAPFLACVLASSCAIPLLAVCGARRLRGRRLALARAQLRLVLACLRAQARVWPAARVHLREVQDIARAVLGLGPPPLPPPSPPPTAPTVPLPDDDDADAVWSQFPTALGSPVAAAAGEASPWGWAAGFPLEGPPWWASC